ncbi:MAG TPA: TrkA C-terminal domain-containing protein [Gemmataceae bacterium]|nr:TrkA C-terminal domain-containing protein [Gemmataceae bacterium]
MDFVRSVLEQQPLLALFLTIAIGYVVGEISVKGFSLGVGAVLFVALGVGWFAPKSAPAAILGNFGLALFLYTIGIQYGKQFFRGLTSRHGLRANLIALTGVTVAGALSVWLVELAGLNSGYALGLFAGSGTSTPTLQAAISTCGNDDPAVGYSVAYPFGVAGPILFLYVTFLVLKPKIEVPTGSGPELLEVTLQRPEYVGRPLGELAAALPAGARVIAMRREDRNRPAHPDSLMARGDALLVVAPTRAVLDEVRAAVGVAAPGRLTEDRRDLDYLRVFASRRDIVGRSLGELVLPGDRTAVIAQVRRGDTELLPTPDLVIEFGDRVGLLAHRGDFPALRTFFGDSIKGTTEFSYVSIGLGMALGFLLGGIKFPIPGGGTIALGLSGVLIVALVLGYRHRTRGLTWTMPLPSNLVLRNLGLTLFLAQVGMASGPKFATAVAETGLLMLGLGVVVVIGLVVPVLVLGLWVFRMPFDDVAGIVSAATGNAAILAFSSKLTPTDRPDVGYAMIFPGMTLAKILFVSVAPAFL